MSTRSQDYSFLSPPELPDEIGRLGSYRILELIGEGGMGKVFLAEDQRLRRKVALKVMSQRIAASKNARERFVREARAQAAVHHDNVATIFEVDEQNNTPFLAMELLKGQSLEQVLRKGYKFNIKQIIALGRQIARGLGAAHKQGIVHRDIKPANIWIESEKGRPKILDFGLAAMTGPVDTLSRRGAVVGTPGYLSPEQAADEPVDDRSDLYSLGIVLYEMCGGMLPFRYSNVGMMLIAITAHSPRPLSEFAEHVPPGLSDLIDRLLSKEPKDRPASADALLEELKLLADESPPPGPATHAQETDSPSLEIAIDFQPEPPTRTLRTKKQRRSRTPLIAAAIATGILALVAGIFIFRPQPEEPLPEPNVAVAPTTPDRTAPVVVTAEMLQPLQIEAVTLESTRILAGEPALVRFRLVNTASSRAKNPAILAGKAAIAAQIRVFLKPESGGNERPATMFPMRIAGVRIPQSGKSLEMLARFGSEDLTPGRYAVFLRLTTVDDKQVSQAESQISIAANYSNGSLSGFQQITTRTGNGADTTVVRGDDTPRGELDSLSTLLPEKSDGPLQYVYLRFDLSQWQHPMNSLQDAVVSLALKGGATAKQELRLYGFDASQAVSWVEKGEGALNWKNAPTANNLGKAKYLCSTVIDNTEGRMANESNDNVRFFGDELDAFLTGFPDSEVTFVVVSHSKAAQNTMFFSKESDQVDKVPSLHLKVQ
ncbi:Serine/threonine-protein kinase Pkn1 [Rosistilla carotiformis]|uniref:Serine/threonine-protein kinase Pkn1 n=1 Tax=Rosistilla carotiformis TaxID=2528017 RepID=A0A518JNE5_9BACT|nr:serine/threonine-protein kinase [Rosistilla carotiformis]QDV67064.1 Serine/threonine-protein kinase Pkn1 [Rosistilla carotiformis]